MGSEVAWRVRATSVSARSLTAVRAPVTPMVEAAYTKPALVSATTRIRSSVEDGATRKIGASPCSAAASSHG